AEIRTAEVLEIARPHVRARLVRLEIRKRIATLERRPTAARLHAPGLANLLGADRLVLDRVLLDRGEALQVLRARRLGIWEVGPRLDQHARGRIGEPRSGAGTTRAQAMAAGLRHLDTAMRSTDAPDRPVPRAATQHASRRDARPRTITRPQRILAIA